MRYARQINCGTSVDGFSDPAGNVSGRLRVHALAGVQDGFTLTKNRILGTLSNLSAESTAGILLSSKMRVGSRCSMPANLDWIKLYRAVLKESDLQKRLAEIEEAERVMKQALRSAVEEGDSDQRRSISDALHQLEIIRRGE